MHSIDALLQMFQKSDIAIVVYIIQVPQAAAADLIFCAVAAQPVGARPIHGIQMVGEKRNGIALDERPHAHGTRFIINFNPQHRHGTNMIRNLFSTRVELATFSLEGCMTSVSRAVNEEVTNHAAPTYTAAYTNAIQGDQAEPLDVLAALLLSLTTAARFQLITAVIRQAISD